MTVIINDFEIVAQPPPQPPADTAEPSVAAPQPSWTPADIERVMRRHRERLARVRAQ
jgi:hypothetical protein